MYFGKQNLTGWLHNAGYDIWSDANVITKINDKNYSDSKQDQAAAEQELYDIIQDAFKTYVDLFVNGTLELK
jgi:hypothetical protein